MTQCEHLYQFMGVVHRKGDLVPGSGARYRIYEDKFFCEKCLNVAYRNERYEGNDYSKPIEGSFPR